MFDRLLAYILTNLISIIRPMLGPSNICPFAVGCTPFALITLQHYSCFYAIFIISKRLTICNPIGIFVYRRYILYLKS